MEGRVAHCNIVQLSHRFHFANFSMFLTHVFVFLPTVSACGCHIKFVSSRVESNLYAKKKVGPFGIGANKALNVNKSSQVSPNARRRAQCKGGGGKEKYMYVHTNDCTTCKRLSKNLVAASTWNRSLGKSEAKHPIEPHFSQHLPCYPEPWTCRTFPVLCPKIVVGAHGNDLLEVDSTQMLSYTQIPFVQNIMPLGWPIRAWWRPHNATNKLSKLNVILL